MFPIIRVSIGVTVLVLFTFDTYQIPVALARSISKRAVPQFMEYENSNYQQPPQKEHHLSNIAKIHPKKTQRSNDNVLGDVTNFRGIGDGHSAFGGPKYAGQYYPFMAEQNLQTSSTNRANNFSFGNLLSGLALWNLANEFNMYSSQDPHQYSRNSRSSPQASHQSPEQRDHQENS